jgi:2-(1,2-epoxy-1,2-dihydrophenyl)acetyl-CoA isomerase
MSECQVAEKRRVGSIQRRVPTQGHRLVPSIPTTQAPVVSHSEGESDLEHHLRNGAFELELSSRSDDFREGLPAFRDERDPTFRGR